MSILKHYKYIAVILFCVAAAAMVWCKPPHPGGDGACYIGLAQSMMPRRAVPSFDSITAIPGGYNRVWEPGTPPERLIPPGYPVLLLPFGRTFAGAKATSFLWYVLGLVFTAMFFHRMKLSEDMKLAGVLLTGLVPVLMFTASYELSDVPYWALSMGALAMWRRVWWFLGLSVVAAMVRPIGCFLLLAWAFSHWRNWRAGLLVGVGVTLLVVLSMGRGAALAKDPYDIGRGQVKALDVVNRIPVNAVFYVKAMVRQVIP